MYNVLRKLLLISCSLLAPLAAKNQFIDTYVYTWGEKEPLVVEQYLKSLVNIDVPKNPYAAYMLGNLYLHGVFLEKDLQKADWYTTMAANQNLPEAIYSIGDGYYSGDIRKQDFKKALSCYEKAAKLGYGPAQFNAGIVLLKFGQSKEEIKKAIFYLDKASKNYKDLNEVVKAAKRYKDAAISKYKRMS